MVHVVPNMSARGSRRPSAGVVRIALRVPGDGVCLQVRQPRRQQPRQSGLGVRQGELV